MEEKTEKTPEEIQHTPTHEAVVKKDPFSLIGKITVIVVLLAILIGGGVYLGMTLTKKDDKMVPPAYTTNAPSTSPAANTNAQVTPTATAAQTKTVTAGGGTGSSFTAYSIKVPEGWTDSLEKTDITNKLILSKGAYSLSIYQAPIGGGGCLYTGDADAMMAQRFTQYVQVPAGANTFRRSWNTVGNQPGKISYTYCQYGTDSYGSPTSFGAVSATSPDPSDKDTMAEIDSMVASLKK